MAAIRKGIQAKFDEAAAYCEQTYPHIPAIAMGHLYAAGVSTSESERDIQIGNQAAFKAEQFNTYFSYIALGHIHQPQRVNAQVPTFYSGSPLMLSFSERQDEKRVLLIDTQNGFEPESIAIPPFRKLLKISGSLEELQQKLEVLQHEGQLDSLIEVEMKEEQYSTQKLAQLDELVSNFSKDHLEIIKYRTQFKEQQQQSSAVFGAQQNLEDLKPKEVFESLLENEAFLPEERQELLHTFDELKEMLTTSD